MASKRCLAILILTLAMTVTAAGEPEPPSLFVVHFERGTGWDETVAPAGQSGFREHSANMNRLRKEGRIVFGARYADVGMILLKAETLDDAKAEMEEDPGVRSAIFTYRIAPLSVFYPYQP